MCDAVWIALHPYIRVLKRWLILLNLTAQFVAWCCLCCRLRRPDDNTSVPEVISLPGEHTLNQKGPVVLLSGDFSSLTRREMWSSSHLEMWHMSHSFLKKMCSFIHIYANYCSLWTNYCSASVTAAPFLPPDPPPPHLSFSCSTNIFWCGMLTHEKWWH